LTPTSSYGTTHVLKKNIAGGVGKNPTSKFCRGAGCCRGRLKTNRVTLGREQGNLLKPIIDREFIFTTKYTTTHLAAGLCPDPIEVETIL